MDWRIEFAPGAERDFGIILDHLTSVYAYLGEEPGSALAHAVVRVRQIRASADRIGLAPGVGAQRSDIGEGVRHFALDRAIFWFIDDIDARIVTVLAVFLAGEDHHRKMAMRLKKDFNKTSGCVSEDFLIRLMMADRTALLLGPYPARSAGKPSPSCSTAGIWASSPAARLYRSAATRRVSDHTVRPKDRRSLENAAPRDRIVTRRTSSKRILCHAV